MIKFTHKYISIFLLLSIFFETNAVAQKKKNNKNNSKRSATRMMSRSPVTKTAAPKTQDTDTTTNTATSDVEAPAIQEVQQAIDPQVLLSKTSQIENLKSQNQLLNNKISEKQKQINDINSQTQDINEKYQNLELKYNRSKNACTSISVKKMGDIQGWLIASVASSGVGTAANATATITSFMQKDETQIDKQNQKALDRATEKARNQEIKTLKNEQKDLSKNIAETNNLLKSYETPNDDILENYLEKKEMESLLSQNRSYDEQFKANANKITELEDNPYTGEVNAKTTSYEQQAKKNKTLNTISTVSSIVGTVASGATTITSTVASALTSSITQQVKKCRESFE